MQSIFFHRVADAVDAADRILLVAFCGSFVAGTVQVLLSMPPNQPHRAEVSKLLVHRSARRRGIARSLMEAAENEARASGKALLVLDTSTGSDAERLYSSLGWSKAGVIPGYALLPDGQLCDTTFLWKKIGDHHG